MKVQNSNSVKDDTQSCQTAVISCAGCKWLESDDRNQPCPICKDYEFNTNK